MESKKHLIKVDIKEIAGIVKNVVNLLMEYALPRKEFKTTNKRRDKPNY